MSTFQVKDPDRIGVAFLGVGRMGLTHAATVAGIRNARVVVVGDPDLAAAERGRALLRADRATADVLDAIHDPAVEAVVVATPTSTHAGLIEAALRAGKAVWSEKPIALDLAETSRVVALWRETGLPVQLGFMRRFDPGYVRAKALDRRRRDRTDRAVPGVLAGHLSAVDRIPAPQRRLVPRHERPRLRSRPVPRR